MTPLSFANILHCCDSSYNCIHILSPIMHALQFPCCSQGVTPLNYSTHSDVDCSSLSRHPSGVSNKLFENPSGQWVTHLTVSKNMLLMATLLQFEYARELKRTEGKLQDKSYICICMYACTCMCLQICAYVNVYVCACVFECVYFYACLWVCLYVCLYACMFVSMCVCIHVYLQEEQIYLLWCFFADSLLLFLSFVLHWVYLYGAFQAGVQWFPLDRLISYL